MTAAAAQPTLPRTAGPPPNSPQFQAEYTHRSIWKAAVLGTINVLAIVLAARLIVLIGVSGGIFLTYLALDHPDYFRIGALAVYCLGVVLPAVYLAASKRG
jgi:hypothetical protein